MTFPITPDPSIHTPPPAVASADQTAAVAQLRATFAQLPGKIIEGLVNAILTSLGATPQQVASVDQMIEAVEAALTASALKWDDVWTQLRDFLQTGDWSHLTDAFNDILAAIFGSGASAGIIGAISQTAITQGSQNVQPVSDFPNAASISSDAAGSGWSWDGSLDHTGTPGSGSAKVTADGTLHAMHGVVTPVQPGQTVSPQAFVMWSGLTSTAGSAPIQFQLRLNSGGTVPIASVSSPASSASWTELSGTYTVPDDGSVTTVQMRLVVTPDALTGPINWDDCTDDISGGWLAELDTDFRAGQAAFGTFLQSCWTALTTDDWSTTLAADLQSAWNIYAKAVANITADETLTIQKMLNKLIPGLFPDGGTLPTGLTAAQENAQQAMTDLTTVVNDALAGMGLSQTGSGADFGHALQVFIGDLCGTGAVVGTNTSNIQHSALPNTYLNINTDLQNLFNDVVFAAGRGWQNIGPDIQALVDDLVGTGHTVTVNAPTQIPHTAVASTAGNADLGVDVGNAQGAVQGVADGIHQAINGDSATGTSTSIAAVKANLTAIPPKNITAQDYGVLAFGANAYSIPPNASIYLPTSKITQAQATGESIGASTTLGLWLAEPGLYSIQTIATFTASAGWSLSGALTPTIVYGDTTPPASGIWSGSHTLPCGTSATIVDSNVTYCICANNNYVRTDAGNRYFMPGLLFSNGSSTTGTFNLNALAMIVIKLSN